MSVQKSAIAALIIITVIQALYTGYQLKAERRLLPPDSTEYLYQAENIKNGIFYSGDMKKPIEKDLYTKRPPLYPLALAAIKRAVNSDIAVIVLQSLLAIFSAAVTIALMRAIGIAIPLRAAIVLLAVLAVTPSQFIYPNFIMTETLFQVIILFMVFSMVSFLKNGQQRYIIIYHLLLSAAMYTKPVMYLFVFPSMLFLGWIALRERKILFTASAVIPVIAIALMLTWNTARTGYMQYSSIQTINLLHYNTYYFLLKTKGDAAARTTVDTIASNAEREPGYAERTRYIHRECGRIIAANPAGYALFHARGVLNFFLDPGRFDIFNFFNVRSDNTGLLFHFSRGGYSGALAYLLKMPPAVLAAIVLTMLGNIIKLAGIIAFLFTKIRLEYRLFIAGIIFYLAFATGPLCATRFAVPVLPLIFTCLAASLTSLRPFRSQP